MLTDYTHVFISHTHLLLHNYVHTLTIFRRNSLNQRLVLPAKGTRTMFIDLT